MNAVEIEQAVSALFAEAFDAEDFPFAFLKAFGNKDTTIKRLRKGDTNKSDIDDSILQRNNIYIATCPCGGGLTNACRAEIQPGHGAVQCEIRAGNRRGLA